MITFQHPPVGALSTPPKLERPLVERMADRVLELGMNGTAVTKDVLAEHTDFTRAEIDQFAPDACDLAKARAVRPAGLTAMQNTAERLIAVAGQSPEIEAWISRQLMAGQRPSQILAELGQSPHEVAVDNRAKIFLATTSQQRRPIAVSAGYRAIGGQSNAYLRIVANRLPAEGIDLYDDAPAGRMQAAHHAPHLPEVQQLRRVDAAVPARRGDFIIHRMGFGRHEGREAKDKQPSAHRFSPAIGDDMPADRAVQSGFDCACGTLASVHTRLALASAFTFALTVVSLAVGLR